MKDSSIIFMFVSALLAAVSQILLKYSARQTYSKKIHELMNIKVITAYALLMLSMLLNIVAFQTVDYKWGPVIASTSYIYVLILSVILFSEKLNTKKLIGSCLVIGGIIVFSL